jgi:hypothetical protein
MLLQGQESYDAIRRSALENSINPVWPSAGARFVSVNRQSQRAVPLELSYLLVPESPEDPDVPELLPVPLLLLEPLPVPPELLPEPEVPEPELPLELEPLPPILEPLPAPPVALLLSFVFLALLLVPEPFESLELLPVPPLLLEPLPLAPLLPDVPLEGVFWAKPCAASNAAAAMIKLNRFILLCCLLVLARRINRAVCCSYDALNAPSGSSAAPSHNVSCGKLPFTVSTSSACYISHTENSSQVLHPESAAIPDRPLASATLRNKAT